MRIVDISADREAASFADRARRAFDANLKLQQWTDDDIAPDTWLALRWNACTVLVLRIETTPLLFDTGALETEREAGNLLDDPDPAEVLF